MRPAHPRASAARRGAGLHVPVRDVAGPQEADEEANVHARLQEVHPPGVLTHQVELRGRKRETGVSRAAPPAPASRWGFPPFSLRRPFTGLVEDLRRTSVSIIASPLTMDTWKRLLSSKDNVANTRIFLIYI